MDPFCLSCDPCQNGAAAEPSPPRRNDRLYAFWKDRKSKNIETNNNNKNVKDKKKAETKKNSKETKKSKHRLPSKESTERFDDDGILEEETTEDVEASENSDPIRGSGGSTSGGSTAGKQAQQQPATSRTNTTLTPGHSWFSRFLVLVLVLGLGALAVLAWFQWQDDDNDDDEVLQAFETSADELLHHVTNDLASQLHELQAMEAMMSSSSGADTSEEAAFWCTAEDVTVCTTWPFVTVPFFSDFVTASEALAPNAVLAVYPRVSAEVRQLWTTYAINNGLDWVEQAYGDGSTNKYWESEDWFASEWAQQSVNVADDWSASTFGIAAQVYRLESPTNTTMTSLVEEDEASLDDWFPQWQAAPLSPTWHAQVNWNLGSSSIGVNNLISREALLQSSSSNESNGPSSQLLYPILDENNNVVARMGLHSTWEDRFQNANLQLSESVGPMVVIVEDGFSNYTFRVHHDQVEYVSNEESEPVHWYDFARVEMTSLGDALESRLQENTTGIYTGAALSTSFDSYSIRIHPSRDFHTTESKDEEERNGLFAAIICILAAGLLLIFIAYGCLVRRRQKALLRSAIQADAVVSSLFPSQVKEKLYEQKQQELELYEQQYPLHRRVSNEKAARRNSNETARRRNSNEMARRRNSNEAGSVVTASRRNSNEGSTKTPTTVTEEQDMSHASPDDDAPIAESYESVSILFADIAGFTKWSAAREPTEIFEFLERLYGGFDSKCAEYRVFKIETIGDCYVAVCGLPERSDDHAVCMVQFAIEMLRIFRQVQNELGDKLDAHKLELRTGIHSGPVTAGVLRGEKARYQLFGDSVNTTARHESSGKPGRIHISKETATLISHAGHDDWIRPRVNKVQMKGKGTLPTWWVNTGEEGVLTEVSEQAEWAWSSLFYCQN